MRTSGARFEAHLPTCAQCRRRKSRRSLVCARRLAVGAAGACIAAHRPSVAGREPPTHGGVTSPRGRRSRRRIVPRRRRWYREPRCPATTRMACVSEPGGRNRRTRSCRLQDRPPPGRRGADARGTDRARGAAAGRDRRTPGARVGRRERAKCEPRELSGPEDLGNPADLVASPRAGPDRAKASGASSASSRCASAEALRDVNAQRQADLMQIERSIGAIQNNTGSKCCGSARQSTTSLVRASLAEVTQ